MDFQNLGKHCSDPTCRQNDFLPFTCKFCTKIYCLDHRSTSCHDCPKSNMGDTQVVICPVCLKTLSFDAGKMSQDEYWNIHSATDCNPANYQKVKEEQSKRCPGKGCKVKMTPLNTYKCRGCRKDVCLKHRFEEDHDCFIDSGKKNVIREEPKKQPIQAPVKQAPKIVNNTSCASQYQQEFCTVCGKGFNNLDDLISHASLAHY